MAAPALFGTRAVLATLIRSLLLVAIFLHGSPFANAQEETDVTAITPPPPVTETTSPPETATTTTPTTTAPMTVVSVFYLNMGREDSGIPYTLFNRLSGSVVGVDATATTYVVTPTLADLRTRPSGMHTRTDNMTTNIPTLRRTTASRHMNLTGRASTITQGPSTFLFTGSNYGPNRTLINRCRLNGTSSATCNLTHVGSGWYTVFDPSWSGEFSTYNYSWTRGDRFGFAPVTVTGGLEKLPRETGAAGSETSSSFATGSKGPRLEEAFGLLWTGTWILGLVVGVFAVL